VGWPWVLVAKILHPNMGFFALLQAAKLKQAKESAVGHACSHRVPLSTQLVAAAVSLMKPHATCRGRCVPDETTLNVSQPLCP
jgi:hypothetical protein